MRFMDFLLESEQGILKDRKEIKKIFDMTNAVVDQDGRVTLNGYDEKWNGFPIRFVVEKHMTIPWHGGTRLAVNMDEADVDFIADDLDLSTLEGFPTRTRQLSISGNNLTSLEGITREIGGTLNLSNNPITSLSGINKQIDSVCRNTRGNIWLPRSIKESCLGLLLIEGNFTAVAAGADEKTKKAIEIIQSHRNNKDLIACKRELVSAGLKEFAKL